MEDGEGRLGEDLTLPPLIVPALFAAPPEVAFDGKERCEALWFILWASAYCTVSISARTKPK